MKRKPRRASDEAHSGLPASMSLNKRSLFRKDGLRLLLYCSPFIIMVFIFSYLPLYGWIYAFYRYRPGLPLAKMPFVGWENFNNLVRNSYVRNKLIRSLINTLAMQGIGIFFSPLPMLFAILLSDIKGRRFKKRVQTITTLPHFISWVLMYAVSYALFSVNDGLVNQIAIALGLRTKGVDYLASGNFVWMRMWLRGTWKELGWAAIIYLAAIAGINTELYEAAEVDGAGRWRRMWHITLPHLLPTFFVLLLLSIASFFNTGFENYLFYSNVHTADKLYVLDLHIFHIAFTESNYSMSIAIGMLKSIVGILLLFVANSMSKLLRDGEPII